MKKMINPKSKYINNSNYIFIIDNVVLTIVANIFTIFTVCIKFKFEF